MGNLTRNDTPILLNLPRRLLAWVIGGSFYCMAQGISWELRPSNTVAQMKHAPFLAAMKQEAR